MKKKRGAWWGIILIAVGAILLIDATGGFDLGELFEVWWPALLVLGGVLLLFSQRRSRTAAPAAGGMNAAAPGDLLEQTNVVGDVVLSTSSPAFRGGAVSTVFGDVTIDCRAAALAPGESTLKVNTVFGDGTLRLPPGAAVRVTANTLFGDAEVFQVRRGGISAHITYEAPGFTAAPARLRVEISQVFGDIDVRS